MKSFIAILLLVVQGTCSAFSQDFNPNPIPFTPPNFIEFKINQPLVHLDINNYEPSIRGLYVNQPVVFRLHLRHQGWSNTSVFMNLRWDSDLDASNGITWSQWETDANSGYFRDVVKTFTTPGKYTVAFEIKFINLAGQTYTKQKSYDIYVAPMPTAVYSDQRNNKLFYFAGADGIYNKPVFLVEGFDPDNANPPQVNYALGFDLIEEARSQGYDIIIMEWANGGLDLTTNKDVFLGACKFLHNQLGNVEAPLQVVAISMGGTIARYGLAWAEDNSPDMHNGQYVEHYVNTLISFDSPQQGAHLNTSLQDFIKQHGNAVQQLVLESAAAQQMLYLNTYGTMHQSFYTLLASLHNNEQPYGYTNGYPRRCVNFSVSNGNHNAVYPNFTTSTPLATLRIHLYINPLDIVTIPLTEVDQDIYAQPRDLWPGSTFPHDLTTLHASGSRRFGTGWFGPIFYRADAAWRFSVNFNPSYTPTESSLDLDGYTRTTNGSLVGGTSWFDGTLEQNASYRHEELTNDSKVQVMNWLNAHRADPYLGRPSNITSEVSLDQIIIRYVDEAALEQGFKVERRLENGPYTEIATLPSNTTQFIEPIENLQPLKTYYYRIRSYSGTRSSTFSQEVSVVRQAHLASNTSAATGPNSQRKVVNSAGVTHMVYESGGSIWYTRSTGSGWTDERRLSISGRARNGSITTTLVNGTDTYVHAAWEENDPANLNYWAVKYAYSSDGGVTWPEPPRAIGSNHAGMASPVVSGNNDRCAVYWKTETGLWGNIEPRLFGAVHPFPVTDPTARDFSAAPNGITSQGRHEFLISYVQGTATNGKVYVTRVQYAGLYFPVLGSTATNVSDEYSWMTDCAHSSIVAANSKILIAWDASTSTIRNDMRPVMTPRLIRHALVREWNGTQWTPVREFEHSTHPGQYPSLGLDLRPGINKVNLVWECGNHIARSSRAFTGTQWSTLADLGQGYAPNITQNVSQTTQRAYGIWTSGTAVPFGIVANPFDDIAIPEGEIDRVAEADLGDPAESATGSVVGKLIVRAPKFEVVRGSTRTRVAYRTESGSCSDWMETVSFTVPSNADSLSGSMVISLRGFRLLDPNTPLSTPVLSVAINAGGQQYSMRTLTLRDLAGWRTADTVITLRHTAAARNLRGKTISVQQRMYGQERGIAPLWSEVVSSGMNTSTLQTELFRPAAQHYVPSSFALHPNYPNPFNPSTRLSFDLPEGGTVQLTVFDVLGRKIRDLTTEHYEPGSYSLDWDGTSESGLPVSSGMYIARFVVRGENGDALFSDTRKLVMMK